MRAEAGDAAAKVADAAREAGGEAMQAASSLASDVTEQAKGFFNMQVSGESLDETAPQLAGLVRNVAERAEEFSHDLREQTVDDLIKRASDFTRKQPALVFGLASLAGFLAFRVLKSSTAEFSWEPERSWEHEPMSGRFESGPEQFHGL